MSETTANPKKKGKVSNIVVTVILVLAIVLAFICSYSAYTTRVGDGVPNIFGYMPFSVQSESMAPVFHAGDLVISKTIKDYNDLEVGDVITFWTVINGYRVLNTHRIIEIQDFDTYRYFETKGDNNTIADSTGVHQRDVVGTYVTHLPKVGTFLDFLQTGKGFFICIVIPVALFFLYELIAFFKALMAYKTEKIKDQLRAEGAVPAPAAETPTPVEPAPAATEDATKQE